MDIAKKYQKGGYSESQISIGKTIGIASLARDFGIITGDEVNEVITKAFEIVNAPRNQLGKSEMNTLQ